MADIYDGVFRTLLNDCERFILPFINEVFGESYTGKEEIRFYPNEHFLDQQDSPDLKRITDTNFSIIDNGYEKKYHLECESSKFSNKIIIRLFEYDAQIALDQGEISDDILDVTFPNTAVLYLRSNANTPEKMHVRIHVPGDIAEYDVPIAQVIHYSIDDIFEKKLYLLIPFHIFVYESQFEECDKDIGRLLEIKEHFRKIVERLEILVDSNELSSFDKRTIIELSNDVIQELTKKYEHVKQEVGEVMSGALIETEARKIKDEGVQKGLQEGVQQVAENMIRIQLPVSNIKTCTGLSLEKLEQLSKKIGIALVL